MCSTLDTFLGCVTYVYFKEQSIFPSLAGHFMTTWFKTKPQLMLDIKWLLRERSRCEFTTVRWFEFHRCHINAFFSLTNHVYFESECLQWKVENIFLLFYISLVLVPMVNVYQTRVLHCGILAGFSFIWLIILKCSSLLSFFVLNWFHNVCVWKCYVELESKDPIEGVYDSEEENIQYHSGISLSSSNFF